MNVTLQKKITINYNKKLFSLCNEIQQNHKENVDLCGDELLLQGAKAAFMFTCCK